MAVSVCYLIPAGCALEMRRHRFLLVGTSQTFTSKRPKYRPMLLVACDCRLESQTFTILQPRRAKALQLGSLTVLEAEDAVVLQEPSDDADDPDVVRDARESRAHAADPAHDAVHVDPRVGRLVDLGNHDLVVQAVALDHDAGAQARARVLDLPAVDWGYKNWLRRNKEGRR